MNRSFGRSRPSGLAVAHLLAATSVPLLACSAERDGEPVVATRDSAGVTIVESAAPAWDSTEGLHLASEPDLTIGVAEGDDAYLFFQIAGALRLPDGRVVVADGGTKEIRFYDSQGMHLSSVGGRGGGPGEFQDIGLLAQYRGDSLFVYDRSQQRATVLDKEGRLGRVSRLAGNEGGAFPSPRAALDDGRIIARSTELLTTAEPWRLWRDTIRVTLYRSDGSEPEALMRLPGMDRYTVESNGGLSINNHPLGRFPELASDGRLIYFLDGGELGVDVYSVDAALIRRIRGAYDPKPVTDSLIGAMKTEWMGDDPTPDERSSVERIWSRMELPEALPAAFGLLIDPSGRVWLGEYARQAQSWQVFDADGRWLGAVQIPRGVRIVQVGGDFVLGVSLDEFGVERVLLFSLLKLQ
jgi:hypothetical protein